VGSERGNKIISHLLFLDIYIYIEKKYFIFLIDGLSIIVNDKNSLYIIDKQSVWIANNYLGGFEMNETKKNAVQNSLSANSKAKKVASARKTSKADAYAEINKRAVEGMEKYNSMSDTNKLVYDFAQFMASQYKYQKAIDSDSAKKSRWNISRYYVGTMNGFSVLKNYSSEPLELVMLFQKIILNNKPILEEWLQASKKNGRKPTGYSHENNERFSESYQRICCQSCVKMRN
jgi:hypothetical protein